MQKVHSTETTLWGSWLNKTFHNHPLKERYEDCMECHISADWLLINRIEGDELILV